MKGRWYIGGLLFVVTVINYVDRQVFSILAPDLQDAVGWSELDYSRIVNAFQLAYAVAMLGAGRILDRIGARVGLAAAVVLWSVAEVSHAFARTAFGFGVARFALGVGEAANFPAALKTVTEWFDEKDRALATGLFNSGVALGTIIASVGVPLVAATYGWQAAFLSTGVLGLLWLPFWWGAHRTVGHPFRGARAGSVGHPFRGATGTAEAVPYSPPPESPWRWRDLLAMRQTWAYAVTKSLGDPIWWFYLFWLPKFLAAQFDVRGTAVIPYLTTVYVAADVGCLAAGWLSSALIKRGWSLNLARKGTMGLLAAIMTPTVIIAGTLDDPRLAIALIAVACGAHQAWSTMVFTIATDLFPTTAVGSVSGLGGFIAGMVSIVAAELIGRVLNTDPTWYLPIFVAAGIIYPVALLVLHLLTPRMEAATAQVRHG